MAAPRTTWNYIEFTGIPELCIESGIFGDITLHNIFDVKTVRRSCKIPLTPLHVLLEFLKEHKYLEAECNNIETTMLKTWNKKNSQSIHLANLAATKDVEN